MGKKSVNALDWTVVGVYLAGMIGLSWYLGRKQADAKDYYLGGNNRLVVGGDFNHGDSVLDQ